MCLVLSAAAAAPSPVTALVFSLDGEQLLVGKAAAVEMRAARDLRLQRTLKVSFPKVTQVAFGPAGNELVIAGGTPGVEGGIQLLAWPSLEVRRTLTHHTDVVNGVAFHPDGSRLVTVGSDGLGQLLELKVGNGKSAAQAGRAVPRETALRALHQLGGHAGPVLGAAFSPDGSLIVTTSADRSVKVWNAVTGELQRSFSHHTEIVHCVVFRPENDTGQKRAGGTPAPQTRYAQCATGSDDGTVRVWQPSIGRMVRIVRGHDGPVFALAYSRDGSRLFSVGREGVIRVIDADSDTILHHWQAHEDWVYSLAISPDGARLASGDWRGTVRLWRLEAGLAVLAAESR